METFFSFIERRVDDCSSLLCVGLDPHIADLEAPTANAARTFSLNLVKQTARYAAAFKPNAAFFEQFGAEGWVALKDVVEAIAEESSRQGSMIPVIYDAKRGDISSTAEAYARAAFETLGAHCITLNPYLGYDSVEPFIKNPEKGVFLLCKTSNKGAADVQDLWVTEDEGQKTEETASVVRPPSSVPLSIHIAKLAEQWNTKNNIGLVVGATQPASLKHVRDAAPGLWFLAPGVGAQGGDLEVALRAGLRADGYGMLIPISRGISRAENPARAAAEFRDEIIQIQNAIRSGTNG
jgi:uridine monophosphate synthetase